MRHCAGTAGPGRKNQRALGQDTHLEPVVEQKPATAAGEFAFGFEGLPTVAGAAYEQK